MVETDLDEALAVGGSPVKAAQEVLRILRDQLRSVIEFGGLSLESYIDFQSNVRGRINRLEAGPPPLRSQQLLALLDAGVVRVPLRPDPEVTRRRRRRRHPPLHPARRAHHGDGRRCRAGPSRSPLAGPLQLAAAQPPLRQGSPDPDELRGHRRWAAWPSARTSTPTTPKAGCSPTSPCSACSPRACATSPTTCPHPRSRLRAVLDAQDCVEGIIG